MASSFIIPSYASPSSSFSREDEEMAKRNAQFMANPSAANPALADSVTRFGTYTDDFSGVGNQFSSSAGATNPGNSGGMFGDFRFDNKTLTAVGSGLSGLGRLAQGWASLKELSLAREAFGFKKDLANRQYDATRLTTNNRINDQNAWKTAQGRTDLAKLVV